MSTTVKSTDEKKPTEWTLFQKRVRTLTGLTPPENMKLCSFLKKSKEMLEWKDSEITDSITLWRASLRVEDTVPPVVEALPVPEEKKAKKAKEAKEPKEDKKSKAAEPVPSTAVAEPPPESITSIEFHLLEAKKKVDTATAIAKKADEDAKKAVDKAEDAMKKALDLKAKAGIATAAATEAQALVIASQKEVDTRTTELEKATAASAAVVTQPTEAETNDEPLHLRRKKAPKQIKTLVWNKYIGSDVAEAPCVSCRTAKISNRSFHCGHVIAESKGGDMTINNLRPICADCNGSMGTRSMNEFTKEFFGWTV